MAERGSGIRQSDEWLRVAEARLGIGFWSWDIATAKLQCSPGLYALAGLNPAGLHLDLAFFETLVHPRDRLPADDPQSFALDPRQSDRRFRIIWPDGQLHHLRSEARHLFDRDGNVTRVVAVISDVTDQMDTQRRLVSKRALLDTVSQLVEAVFWIADEEGRVVSQFGDVLGGEDQSSDDDLTNWRTGIHPDDLERLPALWREAVQRRKPYRFAPRLKGAGTEYQQFYVEGLPFPAEAMPDHYYGGTFSRNPRVNHSGKASDPITTLTPAQVRACRAILDWTAEMLAHKAGVSLSTVRRVEGAGSTQGQGDSMRLIVQAFRDAGLSIWRDDSGSFCVSDRVASSVPGDW
jgi:hypothetical protein